MNVNLRQGRWTSRTPGFIWDTALSTELSEHPGKLADLLTFLMKLLAEQPGKQMKKNPVLTGIWTSDLGNTRRWCYHTTTQPSAMLYTFSYKISSSFLPKLMRKKEIVYSGLGLEPATSAFPFTLFTTELAQQLKFIAVYLHPWIRQLQRAWEQLSFYVYIYFFQGVVDKKIGFLWVKLTFI